MKDPLLLAIRASLAASLALGALPAAAQEAAPAAPQPAPAPAAPGAATPAATPAATQPAPASAAAAPAAPPSGRPLTLAEVVSLAENSPDLAISAHSISAAEARVDSAKSLRLPRLALEASAIMWDGPVALDFTGGAMLPPGVPGAEPIVVRERFTGSVTLTLAQPLTGLAVASKLIRLEEAGVSAARSEVATNRLEIASRAAELYARLLQARAVVEITELSLAQIDAQLQIARALQNGGVLQPVDLMRLESARAQILQQILSARASAEDVADALVLTLGLPAGTAIEPVDDLPAEPLPPRWSETQAQSAATTSRPELETARQRARQAAGGAEVARAGLYPNVVAVATYQRNDGSAFQEKNSIFAGVTLNWDVWDWGKTRADIREAKARQEQAERAAERAVDGISLDVRQKRRAAQTAYEALAVAKQGLAVADEGYRLQSARFSAGDARTIDVLDAEADVTRARLSLTAARYEYAVQLIKLARAVGELPTAAFSR